MRINPWIFGVMVLAIFMGTILVFQFAGVWSVSGKITASGEAVLPSPDDVNSIKGWMTLEEVSTVYHVPVTAILTHFSLPADTAQAAAIKDLESDVFTVTNLRLWLQNEIAASKAADAGETVATQAAGAPTPTPVDENPAQKTFTTIPQDPIDHTITGRTTFQDLLDWGVDAGAIQKIISDRVPDPQTSIKDYCIQRGSEFATVKAQLQTVADQTQ